MAGVPVATIATWDKSHLTTRISVMVSLMPADNIKATAWELTLLVMLILLGTSIVFSGNFPPLSRFCMCIILIPLFQWLCISICGRETKGFRLWWNVPE